MPRAAPQQYTFNAGEVSPLLFGRQDIDHYRRAMSLCFNGVPLVQGAWTRRGGTVRLLGTDSPSVPASNSGDHTRLVTFSFSSDLSFILAFDQENIRVFTREGIVTETEKTVVDITNANPAVATVTAHGYSDAVTTRVLFSEMDGMHQLQLREVVVANATADTFQLKDPLTGDLIDSTNFGVFSSGKVAKPLSVGSAQGIEPNLGPDHDETYLASFSTVQSGDVLFLLQESIWPTRVRRVAALDWDQDTISGMDIGPAAQDGPYQALNDTSTTLTPSGTTGSITVTASSTTGINGGDGFDASFPSLDEDRLIRFLDSAGNWTWLRITAINSTTEVVADVMGPDLASTSASDAWRLGLWCPRNGFPSMGVIFENRLWLGGVPVEPQRFDASEAGLFGSFAPTDPDGTVTDDHAISIFLDSDDVNQAVWARAHSKGLLVGTTGAEWVISASSPGEALTPTTTTARQVSAFGTQLNSDVVKIGSSVVFIQRGGTKVRELSYIFEVDGFRAVDLSVLSEHLLRSPAAGRLAYQRTPQPILWLNRDDGRLIGLTMDRDQDVVAWHGHTLAGASDSGGLSAKVDSLAVLPGAKGQEDELWVVVQRYINGVQQRRIELVSKLWETQDTKEGAFYVDAGQTFVFNTSRTLTGLWHLEGEELAVWADGAVRPNVTVVNGEAELDPDEPSPSLVSVGLPFDTDGETMPVEAGSANGSAQTKQKRIHNIGLWVMDTLELQFGPDFDNLHPIKFRFWGDPYGEATEPFTGVIRERFEGDIELLGQVSFRASSPAPMTLLSVVLDVTTQDDT